TVVYDVFSDAVLGGVVIDGILKISRTVTTRLKTNANIVVNGGGFLDMGTESDSIPKTVNTDIIFVLPQGKSFAGNAADGTPIDIDNDTGLWTMSNGKWELHGAPILRTWSKIAADVQTGAIEIIVENDVTDWHIGGTVVITQTSNPGTPGKDNLADFSLS
ncbi:MAG: G8 domain-containing protein, partial [Bacteroidetes bacterium]|nr:G8 domain-containing protein [Bacteroidota bacterium]